VANDDFVDLKCRKHGFIIPTQGVLYTAFKVDWTT